MRHFLDINQLSTDDVASLLERASYFKYTGVYPRFDKHRLVTLFYENSTRTRVSFELAAGHLNMPVIHMDKASSSESKGETIVDTLKTLSAMGISLGIIRHSEDGLPERLAQIPGLAMQLINAGDGKHAHPSQALLDMMTIKEHKPNIHELTVAIVGNIRHSRVANSLQRLFALVGIKELRLVAPKLWLPKSVHFGRMTTCLKEGLNQADVVICLRVQHERLADDEQFDPSTYRRDYAITAQTISYAKADAMIMHPGPINRGMEIDSDVADGVQSFILQQVTNGVYMRMAMIEYLLNNP